MINLSKQILKQNKTNPLQIIQKYLFSRNVNLKNKSFSNTDDKAMIFDKPIKHITLANLTDQNIIISKPVENQGIDNSNLPYYSDIQHDKTLLDPTGGRFLYNGEVFQISRPLEIDFDASDFVNNKIVYKEKMQSYIGQDIPIPNLPKYDIDTESEKTENLDHPLLVSPIKVEYLRKYEEIYEKNNTFTEDDYYHLEKVTPKELDNIHDSGYMFSTPSEAIEFITLWARRKETDLADYDLSIEAVLNLSNNRQDHNIYKKLIIPHVTPQRIAVLSLPKQELFENEDEESGYEDDTENSDKNNTDNKEYIEGLKAQSVNVITSIDILHNLNENDKQFDILLYSDDQTNYINEFSNKLEQMNIIPKLVKQENINKEITQIKSCVQDLNLNEQGAINLRVGNLSLSNDLILDNIKSILLNLYESKPKSIYGRYFLAIFLKLNNKKYQLNVKSTLKSINAATPDRKFAKL